MGELPEVVILGIGLAGSACASELQKVAKTVPMKVTLVDVRNANILKYAGCRAAALGSTFAYRACIPNQKMAEGYRAGKVINKLVIDIDDTQKMIIFDDNEFIQYDILICASGARNVSPCEPPLALTSLKDQIEYYNEISAAIQKASHVTVLGSGAVGTELAGEIKSAYPGKGVAILSPGKVLVDNTTRPPPARFFARVEKLAKKLGIELYLDQRPVNLALSDFQGDSYLLSSRSLQTDMGATVNTDLILLCTGKRLNNTFYPPQWLNKNGNIKVRPTLQLASKTNVFAIGDINDVNETKQGYFAQKQGRMVARNIEIMLKKHKPGLKTYTPPRTTQILIPMGRELGASFLAGIVFGNKVTSVAKGKDLTVKEHWALYGMRKYLIKENDPNWEQIIDNRYPKEGHKAPTTVASGSKGRVSLEEVEEETPGLLTYDSLMNQADSGEFQQEWVNAEPNGSFDEISTGKKSSLTSAPSPKAAPRSHMEQLTPTSPNKGMFGEMGASASSLNRRKKKKRGRNGNALTSSQNSHNNRPENGSIRSQNSSPSPLIGLSKGGSRRRRKKSGNTARMPGARTTDQNLF